MSDRALTGLPARARAVIIGGGHVDPGNVPRAMVSGARILRRSQATGIARAANGKWRIETERGTIRAEHVVDTGAPHARRIGERPGLVLPMSPVTHPHFFAAPASGLAALDRQLPAIRDDRRTTGCIPMEEKRDPIGISEKGTPDPVWHDHCPWGCENRPFDANHERVMPRLEEAPHRTPVPAGRGIARPVHGAIGHPPDDNPLIGSVPGAGHGGLDRHERHEGWATPGLAATPRAGWAAPWHSSPAAAAPLRSRAPRRQGTPRSRASTPTACRRARSATCAPRSATRSSAVADMVGGPLWPLLVEVRERGGRHACSGAISGPRGAPDLRRPCIRDLTHTGSAVIPQKIFHGMVRGIERGGIRAPRSPPPARSASCAWPGPRSPPGNTPATT